MPLPPPLDETITAGQLGHIDDHEFIALAVNGDYAFVWNELQTFAKPVGTAALFNGNLDGANLGGFHFRVATSLFCANGTNGPRGDSIVIDTPSGDGATFYAANVVNAHDAGAFATKGSYSAFQFTGTHEAEASGAYGELAGFTTQVQQKRTGGLTEGFEAAIFVHAGRPGRVMGFTSVISETNATLPYWDRAFMATSIGPESAGDAYFANGTGGWDNFVNFLHTDGTQRLRIDPTGKLHIGAGARTLYDDGLGLKSDNRITGSEILATGASYAAAFYNASNTALLFGWVGATPEGSLAAPAGVFVGNTAGGAGTSAYVKESGVGNTGWARVLTSTAAKPTGTPAAATDLATVITLANDLRSKLLTLGLIA